MEKLLRQWGAGESLRRCQEPLAPLRPAGRDWKLFTLRWAPLAAGVILMLAAAAIVAMNDSEDQMQRPAGTVVVQDDEADPKVVSVTAPADSELARLQERLDALTAEVGRAKSQMQGIETQLQEAQRLKLAAEAGLADARERHRKEKGDLEDQLTRAEAAAAKANAAQEALQKDKEAAQARLAIVTGQLADAEKERIAALAGENTARNELAVLRAQQDELFHDLQRVFLAAADTSPRAAAPANLLEKEPALRLRQQAMRQYKLLDRAGALASSLRTQPGRDLMARAEAMLLRLDMLNLDGSADVAAFRKTLAQSDLLKQVDLLLATNDEPSPVRVWLLEAKLVLAGAQRVA